MRALWRLKRLLRTSRILLRRGQDFLVEVFCDIDAIK
jgi:hypothetical protein